MTKEENELKTFLHREFILRCKKNPAYSLRAFARFLSLEPSSLSKILRGQRNISQEMHMKLGLKLGLSPSEIQSLNSFKKNNLRGRNPKKDSPVLKYMEINQDLFEVISDWYHYAILELTYLSDFEPSSKWIGKKLGISSTEAMIAVDRLKRVGLLHIDEKGNWIPTDNTTNASSPHFTEGHRKLQKQILQGAIQALDEIPANERDQSSMTMAVDSKRLTEAEKKITKFRRELCKFLTTGEKKDQVFHLNISLYPVTKGKSKS